MIRVVKTLGIAILLSVAAAASAQSIPPASAPDDVAIFAVDHTGQSLAIDPVVILHDTGDHRFGALPDLRSPLPADNVTAADARKLQGAFYRSGTLLSVFFGGQRLGSATVRGSSGDRSGGCLDPSAELSYDGTPAPLLAASSSIGIPGHVSTRRAATPPEASILRGLAVQWLIDYGLDKQLLRRGTMRRVTSTVLRRQAGRSLIGRFDVESKRAIHRLLAIAEQHRGLYRLTLTNLEVQRDIQDGTDKTERDYIDQLDLHNDGSDEVFTSASHYETWDYAIWAFDAQHELWRQVYTGAGGGC